MAEGTGVAPAAAPTAAPAEAPATATPDLSSAPETVRDAPGPDNVQRLAKPIRPIPSLPGVFPDEDPFPATTGASPARGPDGRFLASPSSAKAPSAGEHTRETESADPAAPAEPATTETFEFAGEKFPTREAAEQNFKSLRGQYKPITALAKQLGGVDKIPTTLSAAAESARGWKAAHDAVQAELVALRSGRQPASTAVPAATPAPAPDAPAADEAADVDWELYAEVKKLATERNEPWKAEQWLIGQVRKLEAQRIQKLLDERDAPLKAQRAKAEQEAQTETLFSALSDYTYEDGSPAFPELSDASAAFEVGRMWASLGLPKEHALTPQGAIAAIALYRMSRPKESQARAAAPAANPAAIPSAPAGPTDAQGAADLGDGKQTVVSVPGNGAAPSAEAARILAALRSSNSPSRSVLGFEP